jgi:hypothetical protein
MRDAANCVKPHGARHARGARTCCSMRWLVARILSAPERAMEGKVLERAHEREGQEGGAAGRKVRHAPGAVGGFDEEVNELQGMGGGESWQ